MLKINDREIETILNNAFSPYECAVKLNKGIYVGGVRRDGVTLFSISMFGSRAGRRNDLETYIVKTRKVLTADGAVFDSWTMPPAV